MDIEDAELGGQTVTVFANDDLDLVPESHRDLVTPEIRKVFTDPMKFFGDVATRANQPFPNMAKWLKKLLRGKTWILLLENGCHPTLRSAGFYFLPPERIRGATIGVPLPFDPIYPDGLAAFYKLVGFVDWNGVNMAGKIGGPDEKTSEGSMLSVLNYSGPTVDAKTTRIIGGSLCGDQMVCTADGRGGWWKHETDEVVIAGPIADFIDWVFGELLADRTPESDGVFRKKKRGWF